MQPPQQPIPVRTFQDAKCIDGVHTEILAMGFSNSIILIITQLDNIATMMHSAISQLRGYIEDNNTSIPVQTSILLGSTADRAWPLYEIYASEATAAKLRKAPADERPIVLGISLKGANNVDFGCDTSMEAMQKQRQVMKAIIQSLDACTVW